MSLDVLIDTGMSNAPTPPIPSTCGAVFRGGLPTSSTTGPHGVGSPKSSMSSYRSLRTRGTDSNVHPTTQSISSRLTRTTGGPIHGIARNSGGIGFRLDAPSGTPGLLNMDEIISESSQASFARPEEFEDMVGDLRRVFIGWLKKTESELRKERESVISERKMFEEEKKKAWKIFVAEKQAEYEKLQVREKKQ